MELLRSFFCPAFPAGGLPIKILQFGQLELTSPKSTFGSKKYFPQKSAVIVSTSYFTEFLTKKAFDELSSMKKKYFSSNGCDATENLTILPPGNTKGGC